MKITGKLIKVAFAFTFVSVPMVSFAANSVGEAAITMSVQDEGDEALNWLDGFISKFENIITQVHDKTMTQDDAVSKIMELQTEYNQNALKIEKAMQNLTPAQEERLGKLQERLISVQQRLVTLF